MPWQPYPRSSTSKPATTSSNVVQLKLSVMSRECAGVWQLSMVNWLITVSGPESVFWYWHDAAPREERTVRRDFIKSRVIAITVN